MVDVIPAAALDKHIGILGKTGSGKSNLAKVFAESLLAAGARVCVLDPTGTWWGLRLGRDGKIASLEIIDYPRSGEVALQDWVRE